MMSTDNRQNLRYMLMHLIDQRNSGKNFEVLKNSPV